LAQISYAELFEYLRELGFEDRSPYPLQRVFEHKQRGMVLAFSMLDDPATERPVRPADITSVEFRLQQEGLLIGSLKASTHRHSGP
jgi:hypothetical protein